ncbi:MAG: hypothetical protein ONB17_03760 [candidate division KSB1 bacterium]|nr:hypothetical protein [candidate division KSB1 bacterium]MDZ7294863.1 hypothetical protein [candidate division KSB1 bacterium]MDZ7377970.1 hypothetical protein [candidate division KSB1 bacterium]MDZ7393270.1 hypothetical protein [candidate division KSB1 bacterium]MDZ7412356.1 hypothetical protein [candidate division KSB1 bacterium]
MEYLVPMVVSVAFFASIAWIVKVLAENKTRRVAIEKGQTGEDVARLFRSEAAASSALKWGLVLIGAGLGLVIGLFIVPENVRPMVTSSLSLILAGVGLVIYYVLAKKGHV